VLGLVRAVALVRRGTGATWPDAIGRVLHLAVDLAGGGAGLVQGLFARRAEFLRTPKTASRPRLAGHAGQLGRDATAALGVLGIAAHCPE
jgi:hypothetical protein